jgi:hypothetical protein
VLRRWVPPEASAVDRLDAALSTFTERALRNPRLAWALIAEPVDRLVDAERSIYHERYASLVAEVLRVAIGGGEVPNAEREVHGGCGGGRLRPGGVRPAVAVCRNAARGRRRRGGAPGVCPPLGLRRMGAPVRVERDCPAFTVVLAPSALFGVFCRRWGVPLIDGCTIRLPRLIGVSRAMDMILTGRPDARSGGRGACTFAFCLSPNPLAGGSPAVLELTSLSVEEAPGDELAHGMRSLAEVQSGLERFRSGRGDTEPFSNQDARRVACV